ncbi:rhomboid family intramembrane serine protease [Sanguibacter antarcticus]|uniref:Membrane associated rhomboid family serine protease n=1 Tax=Sanguibacter antarcticus TaxID=372484 RepID=A0A2A9E938_9MICO|nr:rhomboid family intramembrane serine protease [Sanguibacter antarcticus]PFG34749.1 membrane associated rhomboid family serine protease [Sanguibacter antarcticus]
MSVPASQPPVCPRHPDRISYVRCQRCGRPACPECVVQAPVGVQCVDCVREAKAAARPARTVLGAPVRTGRPVVTLTFIGLCAVSYVLQLVVGWSDWTSRWAFAPAFGDVEPWRFLTSAFMHSDQPLHILMNMYALWIVGPDLERMLGRLRFAALYLLSALGGSVAVLLLADPTTVSWYTGTVGASGAVFGLFGAILVVLRRIGRDARAVLVIIGLNFAIGFFVPNISWQGHLGGVVTGTILGALYAFAPPSRRRVVGIGGTVLVAVVLVVCAVVRYGTL